MENYNEKLKKAMQELSDAIVICFSKTNKIKEEGFKAGDSVDVSDGNNDWYSNYIYIGVMNNGDMIFNKIGDSELCTWKFCRSQPKMQKWNVWKGIGGEMMVLKEDCGYKPVSSSIVHTFELHA